MFRKDVQIGLSIGGVLLAVLIVYAVVINGPKKHQKAVALDTTSVPTDRGPGGGDIPPPSHPADEARPSDSVPPAPSTGTGEAPAGTPGVTPNPVVPPHDIDSISATTAEKKQTNWAAILLAENPEQVASSQTPPLAAETHDIANPPSVGDHPVSGAGNEVTAKTDIPTFDPPADGDKVSAPPATQPLAGGRTHTVQRGETFSSISKAVYGDARYYGQIAAANATVNPNRLRPGTVITLPELSAVKASSKSPVEKTAKLPAKEAGIAQKSVDSRTEYRVVNGDSLYKISIRLYGSGEEAEHLYDLNKQSIGSDKSRLKIGMVLKLPGAPTATASR